MLGHRGEVGVMRLTLEHLFQAATGRARFVVSFVELYNEEIRDLLAEKQHRLAISRAVPTSQQGDRGGVGGLELREDPSRGATITGVTELAANDVDTVMGLLHVGNERRTQEPTRANAESSRSHAILQMSVVSSRPDAKTVRVQRTSKLSMIDLAGSERAAETDNRGVRLAEGARINRSLLALGNVINALRRHDGARYVNFRDSKLTRLLKDSLGGNCRTLMLAHASPALSSFEETVNTLKYAHRARAIKNTIKENIRRIEHVRPRAGRVVPVPKKRRVPQQHMSHLKHRLRDRGRSEQLLHRTRRGVLGELEEAVELRKTVRAMAQQQPDENDVLRRDPSGYVSDVLLSRERRSPRSQNQEDEMRLRDTTQKECEALRSALKQTLEGETPSPVNDVLDAEMSVVGRELERLARLEASDPRPDDGRVLKKLELQVRLRNGVIRKLVDEIDRRRCSSRSWSGRLRKRSLPAVDRPASAVESPRKDGDASTILAEVLGSPAVLADLKADVVELPRLAAPAKKRLHETTPLRWRR